VSANVQPALYKEPKITGPRWTGRKRDAERFRARILAHLRSQTGFRAQRCDPEWRQIAWEAWHILKHFYAGEMYCAECSPFIRTSLFPALREKEEKYDD
jgi:hypothetical protein